MPPMSSPFGTLLVRRLVPLLLLGGVFLLALRVALGARIEPADFVFNNGTEVATLDPATVTGVPEGRVIRALYEGLCVQHPETLEPLPGMAERWDVSSDGLVYTFHVRRGARWTNGDPVTAEDFVYSFRRFLLPETAAEYAYQLYYVVGAEAFNTEVDDDGEPLHDFGETVGIRALDEYTLEVTLVSPTPYFLDLMAFYPLFPVNRRSLEEAREKWPDDWQSQLMRPGNLVTNGPFRLVERRVNDRIRLARNEDYWDADRVAFRTIDVLAVEHYGTMLNLYLTGGVDWIDRVAPNVVPRLIPRKDFDPVPYLGSYFYRVNTTRAPFDDPRVRRALALTIDRRLVCEKIMKAGQPPAFAFVPPGLAGYTSVEMRAGAAGAGDPEAYQAAFQRDCEEARRLLDEAGFGPGGRRFPTLEIHYNTSEAHRQIAEVVAERWKRILGIDAKLLNQEWKVYLDTQSTLNYDVSRSAWIGDYPDPNTFLDMFVTGGENNKTGWGNPEFDQLIEEAAREFDPAERMAMLGRAEAIMMEELPILPIYYYVTQNVSNPRLGGFYNNVQDVHFTKFLYWMDDAELAERHPDLSPEVRKIADRRPAEGLYSPAVQRERGL